MRPPRLIPEVGLILRRAGLRLPLLPLGRGVLAGRLGTLAIVFALALVLAGCSRGAGEPSATPTSATAPPATTTVPPTPAGPTVAAFNIEQRLDASGALAGYTLVAGTLGGPTTSLDLAPLGWASGPVNGKVLAGSDDGHSTSISVVDAGTGIATPIATTKDIAWRGVLLNGNAVLTMLSRTDRSDLGLFELDLASGTLTPVAKAPGAPAFGTTWSTELYPSLDGATLAAQDCAPGTCRTRYYDTRSFALIGSDEGAYCRLIGVAGASYVAYGQAACDGEQLADVVIGTIGKAAAPQPIGTADVAVLFNDGTAPEVATSVESGGSSSLSVFSMDGAEVVAAEPTADLQLIDTSPGSSIGIEGPPGWVVLGPMGRLDAGAASTPMIIQANTGAMQSVGTLR